MNHVVRCSSDRGESKPIMKGTIASMASIVILLLISAFVMTVKDLGDIGIQVISCMILSVSSLVGGLVCSRNTGTKGLKTGGIIGGIVFILVAIIGLILHGFDVGVLTIVKGFLSMLFGMIGGVIGVNSKAKRKLK